MTDANGTGTGNCSPLFDAAWKFVSPTKLQKLQYSHSLAGHNISTRVGMSGRLKARCTSIRECYHFSRRMQLLSRTGQWLVYLFYVGT